MAVLVSLGTFVMTLIGGWAARRVTDRQHLLLGLAGGLMLGVVGLDLLPEALHAAGREVYGVPAALLLFVAGFLVCHLAERMLALRKAQHGVHENHGNHGNHGLGNHGHGGRGHQAQGNEEADSAGTGSAGNGLGSADAGHSTAARLGVGGAFAMIGHSFADGVAIGASFQVDAAMGATVAIAVIAHDFADGFNTWTLAAGLGGARGRALALLLADATAPVAGAALSGLVTVPEQVLGCYLGFFAGVLLYIAAAEILPEASHRHPARSTLLCTVAGVLLMWLVIGAAGH